MGAKNFFHRARSLIQKSDSQGSSVHVTVPLGSEEDKIKKFDMNPPIDNLEASMLVAALNPPSEEKPQPKPVTPQAPGSLPPKAQTPKPASDKEPQASSSQPKTPAPKEPPKPEVGKADELPPRRVATVAVKHGDHLLMGKRRDNGKWTTPGGHLDDGEDFHQGALRELHEETGIKLHPDTVKPLSEVDKKVDMEGKPLHVQAFHADLHDRPSTSMLKDPDGEVYRWKWVDTSNGLPDEIYQNLHVPADKNIILQSLGLARDEDVEKDSLMDNRAVGGMAGNSLSGMYDMQQIIAGMDWEMSEGVTDADEAKEIALDNLANDPDFYRKKFAEENATDRDIEKDTSENEEDPSQGVGLNLDIGSGQTREPGYIGLDLYPYDHGTMIHDVGLGIPFSDDSAENVRLVNALHHMEDYSEDPKPLLSEIQRVLMPGGQFHYEGPNEIYNYPDSLQEVHKEATDADGENPQWVKQTFTKRVVPDMATANDSEPRIGIAQNDMLPADALLAMDAIGYYWSDATSSGRGNRLHGYPSQGALVGKILKAAMNLIGKGGPGSGPQGGQGKGDPNKDKIYHNVKDAKGRSVEVGDMVSPAHSSGFSKPSFKVVATHAGNHITMRDGKGRELKADARYHNTLKSVNKSAGENSKFVPIFKLNKMKQIVYGVVLSPNEADLQDDIMTADDIEETAHNYLLKSRVVGSGHTKPIEAYPVESYIAPADFDAEGQYGPQSVKKGAWILGVKVVDPKEWEKVMSGDYHGFSVGGFGLRDKLA